MRAKITGKFAGGILARPGQSVKEIICQNPVMKVLVGPALTWYGTTQKSSLLTGPSFCTTMMERLWITVSGRVFESEGPKGLYANWAGGR